MHATHGENSQKSLGRESSRPRQQQMTSFHRSYQCKNANYVHRDRHGAVLCAATDEIILLSGLIAFQACLLIASLAKKLGKSHRHKLVVQYRRKKTGLTACAIVWIALNYDTVDAVESHDKFRNNMFQYRLNFTLLGFGIGSVGPSCQAKNTLTKIIEDDMVVIPHNIYG